MKDFSGKAIPLLRKVTLILYVVSLVVMTVSIRAILEAFTAKGYKLDTRELALNLFGVRGKSREAGRYDDLIGALRMVDGEWEMTVWEATTDPSPRYLKSPINKRGTAILCPGQYLDTWLVDSHNGWVRTLCQRRGKVKVWRDNDRDNTLEHGKTYYGMFGINFHYNKGAPNDDEKHYTGSAGCQVFRRKSDHKEFMSLVYQHNDLYENTHTYTLFDISELDAPAPGKPMSLEVWANWIVAKEGRVKNGKLIVYPLPKNDGGGKYEVAGINEKYHPKMASQLKRMIERGDPDEEVRQTVKDYIRNYTKVVQGWHPDERVIFYLRDCSFNRGPTGAAEIYQIALRDAGLIPASGVDGKVGAGTKKAGAKLAAEDLIVRLGFARLLRETEKRGPSNDLWPGLNNRWVDCHQMALGIGDPLKFGK